MEERWYVIHTYSGQEEKVKANLEQRIESMGVRDKILEVIVPQVEEIEIKEGKKTKVKKRLFPGYILVKMKFDPKKDPKTWFVVRNTPGVTGFVGAGGQPTPLDDEEVERIFSEMRRETPRIMVEFKEGDVVKITSGPFADFSGVVDEINLERGKVKVLVSFFGRDTPLELELSQVRRM